MAVPAAPAARVALLACELGPGRLLLRLAAGLLVAVVLAAAFATAAVVAAVDAVLPGDWFGGPPFAQRGVREPGVRPAPDPVHAPPGAALHALAAARSQLGVPYVWGGARPDAGFDCSGLVQWAFAGAGTAVPRTAQQQHDASRRLGRTALRPGDLVFFSGTGGAGGTATPGEWVSHVGIYAGGGLMVSAEADGVREAAVFGGYWGAYYAGAGRIGP